MSRKNIILLLLLVIQVAFVAYAYKPSGGEKTTPEMAFFEDISAGSVSSINISDDEEKIITLAKDEDGWHLGGDTPYPADAKKVSGIIDKLSGLKTSRLVTKTKSSHSRLKVKDDLFIRKVTLKDDKGKEETVFLGTSPSYKDIHIRKEGINEVYLAKDLSSWEFMTDNESWWERKYIDLPDNSLTGVSLENENGTVSFYLTEDGEWKMEGYEGTLAGPAIKEFFDKAGHISLTKYEGKTEKEIYGLSSPPAVLTLKTDAITYTVAIGKKDEENKDHVIKSDHSPFYVRVSTYVVEHLLNKKKDDFIVQTPPPSVPADIPALPPNIPPLDVMNRQ